ncbi:MAG: CocE/NonD family hydrolase [Desulfatiglandales bacterium]
MMCRRLLLWVLAITAMGILVTGNGYAKEKAAVFPSVYPEDWGVIFYPSSNPGIPPADFSETELGPDDSIPGMLPLGCEIIWQKDVPVTLRDGTVLYTDIFLPKDNPGDLPAIIAWSPYGKTVPTPPALTVPPQWFSGWAKFEGPDAAFWCCNGYAVVNPDSRGAFNSEGDIHYWGMVDAADGYDVIEWVAKQEWSNGKVGMHGTSWLAIAQWFIAATQPPHLAAIAPWNGLSDLFRHDIVQGGIPDLFFNQMVSAGLTGYNDTEHPWAMVSDDFIRGPYSDDKAAKLENIRVPAYVTTDATTTLHRLGSLEGFRRISSKEKWLRINNTNEWYDQYTLENQQDLLRFFDRYLKGIDNGWEETPRVRTAVLDPGGVDEINVPFSKWPLAETHYRKFYLDAANGSLSRHPATTAASVSYDATPNLQTGQTGQAEFTISFDEDTTVIGYLKLRLWVEAEGANDMDLFVLVEKLDEAGNVLIPGDPVSLQYTPIPPPGAPGRLRVSRRELDNKLSTQFMPVLSLRNQQFLTPGQIVPVDILILPEAVRWHPGQQLRLTVAGCHVKGWFPVPTINAGNHIIHTGLKHQSYLQLPVIPPKQ